MRIAVALVGVMATGCVVIRPPELDERPRWRLAADATFEAGCARASAFVRKSGKQGFGLAIQVRSHGDCSFAIPKSRLIFAHGSTVTTGGLAVIALPGRSQQYAWLPIEFDNNAAWNDDLVDATLELDVAVAGQPAAPWRIAVHERRSVNP